MLLALSRFKTTNMHQTGNVFALESGADLTLNSGQDINILNSLAILSSNIHHSYVLSVIKKGGGSRDVVHMQL